MGLKQTFSANLRKIRREAGLSQMQLALRCNTATSYIGEIEIERRFPSIEMIERIAQELRVSPHLLFTPDKNHTPAPQPRPFLSSAIKKKLSAQLTARVNSAIQHVVQKL